MSALCNVSKPRDTSAQSRHRCGTNLCTGVTDCPVGSDGLRSKRIYRTSYWHHFQSSRTTIPRRISTGANVLDSRDWGVRRRTLMGRSPLSRS